MTRTSTVPWRGWRRASHHSREGSAIAPERSSPSTVPTQSPQPSNARGTPSAERRRRRWFAWTRSPWPCPARTASWPREPAGAAGGRAGGSAARPRPAASRPRRGHASRGSVRGARARASTRRRRGSADATRAPSRSDTAEGCMPATAARSPWPASACAMSRRSCASSATASATRRCTPVLTSITAACVSGVTRSPQIGRQRGDDLVRAKGQRPVTRIEEHELLSRSRSSAGREASQAATPTTPGDRRAHSRSMSSGREDRGCPNPCK